jgi:hypothetical protein
LARCAGSTSPTSASASWSHCRPSPAYPRTNQKRARAAASRSAVSASPVSSDEREAAQRLEHGEARLDSRRADDALLAQRRQPVEDIGAAGADGLRCVEGPAADEDGELLAEPLFRGLEQ